MITQVDDFLKVENAKDRGNIPYEMTYRELRNILIRFEQYIRVTKPIVIAPPTGV